MRAAQVSLGNLSANPVPARGLADHQVAARSLQTIQETISPIIHGKDETVKLLFSALLARGHVLIEDVPGVGKTTIARALAGCVGGTFRRIQFTSDLLPSDIIGVNVYDRETGEFRFRPGPIFANIVLADEINRTAPRTQSSLMEVMNEGKISVDAQTHELARPFMVIATQNPVEHYGTYPLPESQMDRFILRLSMGYPDPAHERRAITGADGHRKAEGVQAVVSCEEIESLQSFIDAVHVEDALLDYVMWVIGQTRKSPLLSLGVSPRGAIAWYRCAQAFAAVSGRDHCEPDDFKRLAIPTLAHRVVIGGQLESGGDTRGQAEQIIGEILDRAAVPL